MKDGRWDLEHPGVKAPGTPKMATFLPAINSERLTFSGFPSELVSYISSTDGSLSPTFTSAISDVSVEANDRMLEATERGSLACVGRKAADDRANRSDEITKTNDNV